MHDVIVIGGGLTGLIAFRHLAAAQLDVLLLEARPRLGGRIFTVHDGGEPSGGHYDLGPAWFWPPHREVFQLADELKIPYFRQYEDGSAIYERGGKARKIPNPQADSVSFRLKGGTGALIKGLQEQLPSDKVLMNRKVLRLTEEDGHVQLSADVSGQEEIYRAQRVIVTLPPRLAASGLQYTPELPRTLAQAMFRTPTWMGNAMKVVVGYDVPPKQTPFWRRKQLAGYAISETGPCQQIHDHCSGEGAPLWKLRGIPLVTPFEFEPLIGRPPVYAVAYCLTTAEPGRDGKAETRHLPSRKKYIFRAAIWNSEKRITQELFEKLTGLRSSERYGTQESTEKKRPKGGFVKNIFSAMKDPFKCCTGPKCD
eukprot:s1714_g15.t1